MEQSGQERVAKALATLAVIVNEDLSAERLEAYLVVLGDLDSVPVERAIQQLAKTARFFPKPAEIRELVEGSPADSAAVAWERLLQAFRKAGSFTSVLFQDGAIVAAVEAVFGSWQQFCEATHPVYKTEEVSYEEREEARLNRREPLGRMIQVGGLTVEMIRARQKDFLDSYRRAVREGKTEPRYVRGQSEIENRATVGSWTKGIATEIDGRKVLTAQVYVQGETGKMVNVEFDFTTAALLAPLMEILQREPLALPPRVERKMLTSENEPPLDPAKVREFISEQVSTIAGLKRMPGESLTDEEWNARKEELQEQAKQIQEAEPIGA